MIGNVRFHVWGARNCRIQGLYELYIETMEQDKRLQHVEKVEDRISISRSSTRGWFEHAAISGSNFCRLDVQVHCSDINANDRPVSL